MRSHINFSFVNELHEHFCLMWNLDIDFEKRVFATLELLCFPVSFFTLFALLPGTIICRQYDIVLGPGRVDGLFDILLSAFICYITNYIAIEILFKLKCL